MTSLFEDLYINGTCYTNDWFRSSGGTGWYNESYGGGIHMVDTTWVRTYGSKNFYCNKTIRCEDYMEAGTFRGKNNQGFMTFGASTSVYIYSTDYLDLQAVGTMRLYSSGGGMYSHRSTDNGGFGIHHFQSNVGGWGALKAYVNANGDFIKNSDIKIKENITPARNYLSDILKLNVVTYTYKNSSSNDKNIGLIAQDVEKIFPSMVKNTEYIVQTKTDTEKEIKDNIKMLAYDAFVPMLIKCTQEQQGQIESQQKTIESLEARLKTLEDLLK